MTLQTLRKTFTRKSICRIGMEFDGSGVTCAQVRRADRGWQVVRSRVFTALSADDAVAAAPVLLQAAAGMTSSDVAAVLPMEVCDLRVSELPGQCSSDELRAMLKDELAAAGLHDLTFDFWRVPEGMVQQAGAQGVCSLGISQPVITRAIERLRTTGLTVAGIDGIPTAAARALRMMVESGRLIPGNNPRSNILAVHIGWKRTTLVLVSNDIPALARVPQIPGLEGWVRDAQQHTSFTATDLLRIAQGLNSQLPVRVPAVVSGSFEAATLSWATGLCEEILRSITFARRPGLRLIPGNIVLMGPGAIIPRLPQFLSEQLNIATSQWSLPQPNGLDASAELAIAAALSAWEVGL
ncbi:MAG: hypothetical protein JNM43_14940 [Planctomycetaceae bacterium]|nr:hypothetical protein [Planctomycetaceae bacterium]